MRILITNDDGYDALGIKLLTNWARKLGDITVVAPKTEQSGTSHAIDFIHPTEIKKVHSEDGLTVYSMASTPADCVRFGILGLNQQYDVIAGSWPTVYNEVVLVASSNNQISKIPLI